MNRKLLVGAALGVLAGASLSAVSGATVFVYGPPALSAGAVVDTRIGCLGFELYGVKGDPTFFGGRYDQCDI